MQDKDVKVSNLLIKMQENSLELSSFSKFTLKCIYDNTCSVCKYKLKKWDSLNKLMLHHIDLKENNNNLNNLMIVCRRCHYNIHHPKK